MYRWILMPLVVVWMIMAAGCEKTQTVDASSGAPRMVDQAPELVAKANPPVPDLPIPLGFSLSESGSRSFSAAGSRYIDHVYKGNADRFAVARFYKRQMPISRWVLVTDMFVQGDLFLDFEKESERCRVIISGGSWPRSTRVKVQLWTSGRIDPRSAGR